MKIVRDWFRHHFSDPQVVVLTLFLVGGILVIMFFGRLLAPLLASLVIAYLLEGVIKLLRRWNLPRLPAVLSVYLTFLTLFALIMVYLVPLFSSQFTQAVNELPAMIGRVHDGLRDLPERYEFIDDEILNNIFNSIRKGLQQELTERTGALGRQIVTISFSSFRSVISLFVYLVLMPILIFFLLKDKDKILAWCQRFLPRERGLAMEVWHEVDRQIGNYVRGKSWEIIIVTAVTFVIFWYLKLNFAMLLSILVGLSVIVPYVGATIMTFPVAVVAYAQWGFGSEFVWVLVAYAVIQALDGNLLAPLLMSEAVQLHPIAIIVAVLVFGGIWGFWGAFFAIPLASLVQAVLNAWPRTPRDPEPAT